MSLRCWGIVGGFTRSRKYKEIDISIDVIVPLYFIYSQQNTMEQGKGIIKKTTESKDKAKSR